MNWKDVVVGAVATLVVTVLGGVGVYYVTKEPEDKKNERLSFVVSDPASFKGSAQDLSFRIIRLSNQGGVAAKNVVISLNFKTTEIRDLPLKPVQASKNHLEIKPIAPCN